MRERVSSPADNPSRLRAAYGQCARITRGRARNFYYTFLTLPRGQREAIYAVYTIFRWLDDIADDQDELAHKMRQIKEVEFLIGETYEGDGSPEDPRLVALGDVIRHYGVPREYFDRVVRGVEMDLIKSRYQTFEELHLYCRRVASAVGLICLEIFEYTDSLARRPAEELGIGMQLTNILRDIPEDLTRGRIYLPLDELERYGYSEGELISGVVNGAFQALMRFQVDRAREHLRSGAELLKFLPLRSRACPASLAQLYERILERIVKQGYDVFRRRVSLRMSEKLFLTSMAWMRSLMLS